MKLIFIILFSLSLISCGGLSEKEKQNIIDTTCSFLKETDKSQGAFRVKELNLARNSLSEEVFTDGDGIIYDAIQLGLCESLVANSPDFKQRFTNQKELKLENEKQHKEALALKGCNEMNLSYLPQEITEENNIEVFCGTSFDVEFIESINTKKISVLESFRKNNNLPSFQGSVTDIVKLQFLGLCKELLLDDSDKIAKRLKSYEKLTEVTTNKDADIHINTERNYVTKEGKIFFLKTDKTNGEIKRSFINLETLNEKSELKFDGTTQLLSLDDARLSTDTLNFEVRNGKFIDYKSFYHNGELRILTSYNDNGTYLKSQSWYINGQLRELKTYDKVKGTRTVYEPNGEIRMKIDTINGKREGLALFWGGKEECYKNGEEVDMKQCQ